MRRPTSRTRRRTEGRGGWKKGRGEGKEQNRLARDLLVILHASDPEHASSSSLSDVLHVLHAAATRTEGGDALLFSTAFSAGIARVAREA